MKKEKSSFRKNIKKMWPYIKRSKYNLIIYACVSMVEAIIGAIIPLIAAKIIINMTNGVINQLVISSIIVFLIELLLNAMYYLKGFFYQRIYQQTLVGLQIAVAKETLNIEVKEIDKNSSGVFIDRLNKDTEEISDVFTMYTYYLSYVITNIGVLIAIFILNKYMFIYSIVTSTCIFITNKIRLSKQYAVKKSLKKIKEQKTGLTSELVRGIRDIKVLNASNSILNQTSSKIIEASHKEIEMYNIERIFLYLENNIRTIFDFIFIIFGCYLYRYNLISIPTFVIIYNYKPKVKNLLVGLVRIIEYNKMFVVSSDRIFEVIENNTFKKENFGNKVINKVKGNIKFINVTFGYNKDMNILKNISFEIKPNEKVAFVGKSGAGKSTILSLITKLYNVNNGKILIDNIDINELTCDSLRNNMSIITQNPYIFNFSIKDNLLLANKDASFNDIRKACKLACIDKFIMSLPDGYDTMVGENGIILSGGQKQRLAIARALLLNTEIILFDEATSALDNETQSEIKEAIENLKGKYTILIVAHRLTTVVDCDRIFVVDNGTIIDSGSHNELIKKSKFYKSLYEKDLSI